MYGAVLSFTQESPYHPMQMQKTLIWTGSNIQEKTQMLQKTKASLRIKVDENKTLEEQLSGVPADTGPATDED